MSASIKISVIIPVYNLAAYLSVCLQSIVTQTLTDIEIIAVNDGSTDNSADILSSFAQTHPCLKIITQNNQGPSAAREAGVTAAGGEFLLFVDGDDVIDDNYCARLWQVANQEQADLVLAPVIKWEGTSPAICPNTGAWRDRLLRSLQKAQRAAVFEDFDTVMPLYGKLIARSLFEKVEARVTSYRNGEDISPSVQLLSLAKKIALAPDTCYFYRQRENSQSKEKGRQFEGLLNGFLQARRMLKKRGIYKDVAPGFEYVCRVCLTSFMETHDLIPSEEKMLLQMATQMRVPAGLFQERPWRFRLRQYIFDCCLKYGFSYAKIGRLARFFRVKERNAF